MSEARLLRWRGLVGWLTTVLCLGAVLSLVDSFVASFRTGPVTSSMLAGGEESLSGPMPPGAADAASLIIAIDHPGLRLDVTTEAHGFWFGNRLWQGQVRAAPDTAPGTATVSVAGPDDPPDKPAQRFTLHVFADQQALDAASPSRIRRLAGLPPLAVAAGFLLLAILPGTLVFFISHQVEALRAREGRAEIYKTRKTPDGLVVTFGLGSDHGLASGASVTVRDQAGHTTAVATVQRCAAAESDALVTGDGQATCGAMVWITAKGE
jgi:hypothetical protein